jgi:ABC-type Fe3+-siderophore transport system permease subunit
LSEFESHVEINMGSEKGFGVVFAIVFFLIGLYPLLHGGPVRLWALVAACILLALAFLAPKTLSVPNKLWFKLGMALGAIVAPIVMALVYFNVSEKQSFAKMC